MRLSCKFIISALLPVIVSCAGQPTASTGHVSVGSRHAQIDVVFTSSDRGLIHSYYAKAMGRPLPPGLAKKKHLPPGHQKQLYRHGQLPPGLEHHPLPSRLESQLSRLPQNYLRLRIGNDIVLMDGRTNVIVDIIYNFGR